MPVALVFDVLDGRIARWRQSTSAMGRELDSLADVIRSASRPRRIAYGCGMQGLYDRVALVFFVACGVSRLARYNVTAEKLADGGDKVKYFEGTPIPTSLVLVVVLGAAAWQGAIGEQLWFGACRDRRLQPASAGADVRAVGLADGEPDPHPEAVGRSPLNAPCSRARPCRPA